MVEHKGFVRNKHRVPVENLPIQHWCLVGNHRLHFGAGAVLTSGPFGGRSGKVSSAEGRALGCLPPADYLKLLHPRELVSNSAR
jgi:hypothetical protein